LVLVELLLLTAALAGLWVLNGQALAALDRSKEVGVLKAPAFTCDQLAGATLIEAGLAGHLGGALGVAILIPISAARSPTYCMNGCDPARLGGGIARARYRHPVTARRRRSRW